MARQCAFAIAERTIERAESFIHQLQAELATVAPCQAVTIANLPFYKDQEKQTTAIKSRIGCFENEWL